jgi:hypothetical protein
MKKIENIKNKLNKDAVYVIVFAVCIYLFSSLTCTPREFSDDDWGIANYFAGLLDADYATPYNKFINFIWGWIMYGMYQLFPGPNWFIVIQEMIVVFSFAVLQYMLIHKMKEYLKWNWCCLLTSAILAAFEPSYICRLEFSQTAALGSVVGFLLVIFSYEKHSRVGIVAGIVLTVVSAMHRFGSFEMCLPFVALVLIHFILKRSEEGISIKAFFSRIVNDKKLFLIIAGIILCCFTLSKMNTLIYNSDYYAEYNAFNSARASVLDYSIASYEDIADELQEIGVSENDYTLMISWTFADLSFFTTDLFRQVAEIEPKASTKIDYRAEIEQYFTQLEDASIIYNQLFYFALVILLLCIAIDFKHMIIYSPLLLAGTILMEIYFTVVVRRYPSYVRTGLLFCLIATALMLTDFSKFKLPQKKWYVIVADVCVIFFLLASMGNRYYVLAKGNFEYNMDGLAMYEYMNSREDDIFMIPTGASGGLPALRNSYSIFTESKPGISRHIVGLGGWSTNNPWVNEVYQSWGIDYPMSQTADDNVYLCATLERVNGLRTYLMEHHGMSTSASLSAVEYGTTIYKITDNNMEIEEDRGSGIIRGVDCSYDSIYDTYDIEVAFSEGVGDSYAENARVYLSMEDADGNVGYYMVYNGNSMDISDENDVLIKVPASYINNDTEYAVNIVVQSDEINQIICSDDAFFRVADVLQ